MTKTQVAFILSARRMFECFRSVYFWTITFDTVFSDDHAAYHFGEFLRALNRKHGYLIQGLRVVEVHPGGHGLHYHMLLSMRVNIRLLMKIGKPHFIGRVHVKRAAIADAEYLAKYLVPNPDYPLAPRARRWGAIGGFKQVAKNRLEVDSIYQRNMRALFGGQKANYNQATQIFHYSKLHNELDNWPKAHHLYDETVNRNKACRCYVCLNNRKIHKRTDKTYWIAKDSRSKTKGDFTLQAEKPWDTKNRLEGYKKRAIVKEIMLDMQAPF